MNLKGRNFLTLKDFTPEEITYMIDLAADLKAKKKAGELHEYYRGKNIALIFEKQAQEHAVPSKWQLMIWEWVLPILIPQAPRLERRRASQILQEFSEECMRESSTVASGRILLRSLRSMQVYRYGMA